MSRRWGPLVTFHMAWSFQTGTVLLTCLWGCSALNQGSVLWSFSLCVANVPWCVVDTTERSDLKLALSCQTRQDGCRQCCRGILWILVWSLSWVIIWHNRNPKNESAYFGIAKSLIPDTLESPLVPDPMFLCYLQCPIGLVPANCMLDLNVPQIQDIWIKISQQHFFKKKEKIRKQSWKEPTWPGLEPGRRWHCMYHTWNSRGLFCSWFQSVSGHHSWEGIREQLMLEGGQRRLFTSWQTWEKEQA